MWQIELVKYVLWVIDMPRAVAFYRDVMRLPVRWASDDWSEVGRGDFILGLHAGANSDRRPTGLGFQVTNLEAAITEILAGGGTLLTSPTTGADEPIRRAELLDPEGNTFMVTELVHE